MIVKRFMNKVSKNANNKRIENNKNASRIDIIPVTKGRFFVRATYLSKRWSAISLITHPAERINRAPRQNKNTRNWFGWPPDAIQNAHNVGHNKRKKPTG